MGNSAELDLKTAISMLDEATEHIEPLKNAIAQSDAAWDASFWEGLKDQFSISRESGNLLQKCEQSISLASSAKSLEPNVSVILERDDTEVDITPHEVIGAAYINKGVLYSVSQQWEEAQYSLEQSLNNFPTSDAQLRLSDIFAAQGLRDTAMQNFQKVIDQYPESAEAVEAKKALIELEQTKLRKWSTALLLSIFLGWAGVDRFYLSYIRDGFIKLCTVGGFYVWWLIDIVRIATNNLRDANGMRLQK